MTAITTEILFVGRLVKRKGCAWFIRNVLPELPQDTVLQVAGTVSDREERSALEAPNVEYCGSLRGEALTNAYRNAMCVIVPNIELANGEFEGFGLVATEAAAAGGVVLAARCGGLPEAVVEGRTGFLVAAGNPADWVGAIQRIGGWSEQERADYTSASVNVVREHFSWRRVALDVAQIYCEAVDEEC
ncbi:glycosyltransferase family 4 protein [Roseibium salinum]|uniref:glycosyltransferase family 4 protein n=1 Tax=Roseibium salinum TaxID=1604349 RepID=UPI00360B6C40